MSKYQEICELWQQYNITSISDIEAVLDNFRVLFAYHSGKIENEKVTYNDTREIFENGRILNYTGETKALFEQQNQKLCYEYLKDKIIDKTPLSLDLLKEIHRILTSGTYDERRYIVNNERPGEFKKHDYVTGIHEVGSAVEEVERHLSELFDEVNDYTGKDLLTAAAYLHARFESIHPFADGNGRVGRTVVNYYLMINNHPPMIIYDEDKRLYYDCLRKYDEQENISSLKEFFIYETEKTWENTLRLTKNEEIEHKGLSDFI